MIEDITKFLRTPLIVNKNIYIDLWTIVHFITGYLMYSYLKLEPGIAVGLIFLFEWIEPQIPIFRREHRVDTLWDLIITTAGYFIARGGV